MERRVSMAMDAESETNADDYRFPGACVSHPVCWLTRPNFWKARLIQEPLFSVVGSPPAFFTRL